MLIDLKTFVLMQNTTRSYDDAHTLRKMTQPLLYKILFCSRWN